MTNKLYYGDNLDILREHIASESVDLIYLDPPFNSNANYAILFKDKSGRASDAQIEAFEDTWHWNQSAQDAFDGVMESGNVKAADLLRAMRTFLGDNDMMAYLAMMAIRLIELHRVLKPTGSLYLHCDPTASHYLKLLLDGVFGPTNYRNEIVWKRQSAHSDARTKFASITDSILFYAKSEAAPFTVIRRQLGDEYQSKFYRYSDPNGRIYRLSDMSAPEGGGMAAINKSTGKPNGWYEWRGYQPPQRGWRYSLETMERLYAEGRIYCPDDTSKRPALKRYLDENKGHAVGNIWDDINSLNAAGREALGYPTQKPLALLERIIAASSNEGEVVLDPFCGCGTAVHAAQKLGRQWIGIDITHLAISLIEKRMHDAFPGIEFTVEGQPKSLADAMELAARDKHQFELWAVAAVNAIPARSGKKGPGPYDGVIYFKPDGKRTEKAIVEVKGGGTSVKDIRNFHSAMERENAPIGVFVTAELPTQPMRSAAAAVGSFKDEWDRPYPRLQILTLAELFQGKKPDIPFVDPSSIKKAKREDEDARKQGSLL